MEGFGKKINLSESLSEDFVPLHSGFVSTQSEVDTSTELDDTSEISTKQEAEKPDSSLASEPHKGIKYLENEFQLIRRSIASALNSQKEDQQMLVLQLTKTLINIPAFQKVVEFYNLNSHLIDPVHFLKMVIELGDSPTENLVQRWVWIFTGITMERQLSKDTEIAQLKELCRSTCKDIQNLTINTSDALSQVSLVINEAKQVQMATHDSLIQIQEIINEKTIPTLPQSVINQTSSYEKQWILPPLKITWDQGQVSIKSGKINPDLLNETKALAALIKTLSLQDLQLLGSLSYEQLLGVYSILNNKSDKEEFKNLLASFS